MSERDEAQLQTGAGHVAYEVVTMHNAAFLAERRADLRTRRPLPQRDTYLHIFTDAALVHARNVLEFLTTPKSNAHPNTLLAVDFTDKWQADIHTIIGRTIAGDDGITQQLHQLVAHISVHRQRHLDNIPQPRWPFMTLSDEIQRHYQAFLALLPPRRREWFDENRANLQRLDPESDRYRRRSR